MDLSQSIGACPVCRSTKYHKNDGGFLMCEFGHQSQGFWEEHDDNETYFGVTRRLQSQRSIAASRLSQLLDEKPLENEICTTYINYVFIQFYIIVRSGDVDRFITLEIIQILLKRQISDLGKLMRLPSGFERSVKTILLTYATSLNLTYDEEGVHEVIPSRSRSGSQVSLQLESEPETQLGLSSAPSGSDEDEVIPRRVIINGGRIQISLVIPILALAFSYHQIPLYLCDVIQFILDCKIAYFDILNLIPKSIEKHISPILKSFLRNPLIPDYTTPSKYLIQMAKMMFSSHSIPLPKLDIRLIFWRIGEYLCLPHLFREDLIAMAVRMQMEDRLAIKHERFSSNPLVSAFALSIFFLKLHYGLFDSIKDKAENSYTASGFPTQYQLVKCWERRLEETKRLKLLDSLEEDLEFYRKNIIAPRIEADEVNESDFDYLKRALDLEPIMSRQISAVKPDLPWIKSDLNVEIEIDDTWAKNYACNPINYKNDEDTFGHWSRPYTLLLDLGSRFCCCSQKKLESSLISTYETGTAREYIRNLFS